MVTIENLSFSYQKRKPLFNNLSLSLKPGNMYGLLGKNGAGKTTLFKIICGLLFPKQGMVKVAGYSPKDRYPGFLSEIFLLPEEFSLPSVNIESYVRLYSPFYQRFNKDLFDDHIHEFRLSRDQKLSSMSYGQKKKFLISFGMATDCKLMLLDEPTNGLDIPSKSQFRKIMANSLHDERSFIISTHQVRDMENLIDPVIILDDGKIIFCQDCLTITETMLFSKQSEPPRGNSVIYMESTLGGYSLVEVNKAGAESRINLELLFNAVLGNREKMNELFNNK
jgi:ABC-2 type transport system ATP-binding protein